MKAITLLLLYMYMSGTGCTTESGHIYSMYPGGK